MPILVPVGFVAGAGAGAGVGVGAGAGLGVGAGAGAGLGFGAGAGTSGSGLIKGPVVPHHHSLLKLQQITCLKLIEYKLYFLT